MSRLDRFAVGVVGQFPAIFFAVVALVLGATTIKQDRELRQLRAGIKEVHEAVKAVMPLGEVAVQGTASITAGTALEVNSVSIDTTGFVLCGYKDAKGDMQILTEEILRLPARGSQFTPAHDNPPDLSKPIDGMHWITLYRKDGTPIEVAELDTVQP